ncbi:MAG: hypothetical protein CSB24_02840 [Deltaproteobacteria bacterium]|nr:MAG: hypothetical protein CSB24_02840 [Deltaproteobacteria bacterium]
MVINFDNEKQARAIERAQGVIMAAEKKSLRPPPKLLKADKLEELLMGANPSYLANRLDEYASSTNHDDLNELFKAFDQMAVHEDPILRENAVMALGRAAVRAIEPGHTSFLYSSLIILSNWLKFEDFYFESFGDAACSIRLLISYFLQNRLWREAEVGLSVFYQVQTEVIVKPPELKDILQKVHSSISTRTLLESMVGYCLEKDCSSTPNPKNCLKFLGSKSAIYLLNRLMRSDHQQEREKLIKLIVFFGHDAAPVLADCLQKNTAWFVVRNVILIIAEIDDSSLFYLVSPLLSHKDIRVQEEILKCIVKFGGARMKGRLIEALFKVNYELKADIVTRLGQIGGNDSWAALIKILETRYLFPKDVYVDLLTAVCVALRAFPGQSSVEAITELIQELEILANPENGQIIQAAKASFALIKPRLKHARKNEASDEFVSFDDADEQDLESKVQRIEEKLEVFLEAQEVDKACVLLVDNIKTMSRNNESAAAEYLKEKFLAINPTAFHDAVESGTIEKISPISADILTIWHELHKHLGEKQFEELGFAMNRQYYEKGETIIRAGEIDAALYFINKGTAGVMCGSGRGEIFLKKLAPADIIGVSSFFSSSVWTYTLIAQSAVQVDVLTREKFLELCSNHPDLKHKLYNYCRKFALISELVKVAGTERRSYPRYRASAVVHAVMLDYEREADSNSFKAEMLDISRGGMCFSIPVASRKKVGKLIGRQISSRIKTGKTEAKLIGSVVSVHKSSQEPSEFNVHLEFAGTIEEEQLKKVLEYSV